jgi:hypothetical protein
VALRTSVGEIDHSALKQIMAMRFSEDFCWLRHISVTDVKADSPVAKFVGLVVRIACIHLMARTVRNLDAK